MTEVDFTPNFTSIPIEYYGPEGPNPWNNIPTSLKKDLEEWLLWFDTYYDYGISKWATQEAREKFEEDYELLTEALEDTGLVVHQRSWWSKESTS